jgi:hypothetical protein
MKREEAANLHAKVFEHADLNSGEDFSLQKKIIYQPQFFC